MSMRVTDGQITELLNLVDPWTGKDRSYFNTFRDALLDLQDLLAFLKAFPTDSLLDEDLIREDIEAMLANK